MFDALAVPPRMLARALDDLHTLAEGVRRLTDREGDLSELIEAVKTLPEVEDRLSLRIEELRADVQALHEWLQPLHQEVTDLDATAEKLEQALGGLEMMLKRLPGI
jgi:chromosome segregation ATPase